MTSLSAPAAPSTTGEYLALCRELAQRGTPLTPEELATYNTMRAAEMARAEARRNPPREPDLLDEAA